MAKILFVLNPIENFSNQDLTRWSDTHPAHELKIVEKEGSDVSEIIAANANSDVLLCTYADYSATTLKLLPNLRAIITTTTATEYVDLAYCQQHNIAVYNNAAYTGSAVAEHLLALLLTLARKLPLASHLPNNLPTKELLGFELMQKTLGVLGYGYIGKRFATMAEALGMKVLIYTRSLQPDPHMQQLDLAQLLPRADILACTLPLTDETKLLMNQDKLRLLPPGAVIISTSPEEIFDLSALHTMLISGALGGVGLDLHSERPEFYKLPNFVGTRVKGTLTKECVVRRTQSFLGILDHFLSNNFIT